MATKFKKERTELKFSKSIINRNILLPIKVIGKDISVVIEKYLKSNFEGKCIIEGYVKQNSIKYINSSSGVVNGSNILLNVIFECEIYYPVANMKINCIVKNVTKAGIKGESATESPSPFIVFIARDHQYNIPYFQELKEGDVFNAKVIGQRFELNDTFISIIAEVIVPKELRKPKLLI